MIPASAGIVSVLISAPKRGSPASTRRISAASLARPRAAPRSEQLPRGVSASAAARSERSSPSRVPIGKQVGAADPALRDVRVLGRAGAMPGDLARPRADHREDRRAPRSRPRPRRRGRCCTSSRWRRAALEAVALGVEQELVGRRPQHPQVGLDVALAVEQRRVAARRRARAPRCRWSAVPAGTRRPRGRDTASHAAAERSTMPASSRSCRYCASSSGRVAEGISIESTRGQRQWFRYVKISDVRWPKHRRSR